jgi:hypothetical protein
MMCNQGNWKKNEPLSLGGARQHLAVFFVTVAVIFHRKATFLQGKSVVTSVALSPFYPNSLKKNADV